MDIEKQEEIINDIYELQQIRKRIINSNKITFNIDDAKSNIIDMYCSHFFDYSILIKGNLLAENYKDSVIKELDVKIKSLIDKLKDI